MQISTRHRLLTEKNGKWHKSSKWSSLSDKHEVKKIVSTYKAVKCNTSDTSLDIDSLKNNYLLTMTLICCLPSKSTASVECLRIFHFTAPLTLSIEILLACSQLLSYWLNPKFILLFWNGNGLIKSLEKLLPGSNIHDILLQKWDWENSRCHHHIQFMVSFES